jgi:predicted transcriptional regulator YdeE
MNWPGWKLRLGAVVLATGLAQVLFGGAMGPKVVEDKGFAVIGIEVRTNNAKESGGGGAIPKQWDRFFKEGIVEKIPDKAEQTIFVVYSEYAGDRNGDYNYTIGARVKDIRTVPPGMVAKRVSSGKYAVVTSAKGRVTKIVPEAWQRIWDLEDKSQLGGSRAYRTDFEVYDQRSRDPQDSQVDIYVGLQ